MKILLGENLIESKYSIFKIKQQDLFKTPPNDSNVEQAEKTIEKKLNEKLEEYETRLKELEIKCENQRKELDTHSHEFISFRNTVTNELISMKEESRNTQLQMQSDLKLILQAIIPNKPQPRNQNNN